MAKRALAGEDDELQVVGVLRILGPHVGIAVWHANYFSPCLNVLELKLMWP